MGAKFSK
jgi:hypothetical protein